MYDTITYYWPLGEIFISKIPVSISNNRFEHYKRPPSRERSVDKFGTGSRHGSRQQLHSRDASRDRLSQPQPAGAGARPGSRQRTPLVNQEQTVFSENNKNNGLDSLNLDSAAAKPAQTGNGSIAGNNFSSDFKLPAEDQIRFRGVQQEIPHFGAPPKRTESLYMKPSENNQQATFKVKILYYMVQKQDQKSNRYDSI